MQPRRLATNCFVFTIAFLAVVILEDAVAPPPPKFVDDPAVAGKLDYLERAPHGSIDVLFIGQSTVDRGIDVVEIDRHLDSCGRRLTSFNLGVHGLAQPEALAIVRRLSDDRRRFQAVIIEPVPPTFVRVVTFRSSRIAAYSRLTGLPTMLYEILSWGSDDTELRTLLATGAAFYHSSVGSLGHLFRAAGAPGAGAAALDAVPDESMRAEHGFHPFDAADLERRRSGFLRDSERFERRLEVARVWRPKVSLPAAGMLPGRARQTMALLEAARDVSANVGVLMLPQPLLSRLVSDHQVEAAIEAAGGAFVMNLNDPLLDRGMYQIDAWQDPFHLTPTGAQRLAPLIARRLCSELPAP